MIVRIYDELDFVEPTALLNKAIRELTDQVLNVRRRLDIYTGEAYRCVFDSPSLGRALRLAHGKGVETRIVAGPVISTGATEPQMMQFAREGIVKLYCRPTRGNHDHFRIADDSKAFVQNHHPTLARLQDRGKHEKITDGDTEFNNLRDEMARYADDRYDFVGNEDLFIRLSSPEIRGILDIIEVENMNNPDHKPVMYDDLTRDELVGYQAQYATMVEDLRTKMGFTD